MKGVVLVIVLLLAVPMAFAADTQSLFCKTRYDCYTKLRSVSPVCGAGTVKLSMPDCVAGACSFCRLASARIQIGCNRDIDCTEKTQCKSPLAPQCVNTKCICAAKKIVECYSDNDCTRSMLGYARTKLVCQRGKCLAPQPKQILLPSIWGRAGSVLPTNSTR